MSSRGPHRKSATIERQLLHRERGIPWDRIPVPAGDFGDELVIPSRFRSEVKAGRGSGFAVAKTWTGPSDVLFRRRGRAVPLVVFQLGTQPALLEAAAYATGRGEPWPA